MLTPVFVTLEKSKQATKKKWLTLWELSDVFGDEVGIEGPVRCLKRAKALLRPSVLLFSGPCLSERHPHNNSLNSFLLQHWNETKWRIKIKKMEKWMELCTIHGTWITWAENKVKPIYLFVIRAIIWLVFFSSSFLIFVFVFIFAIVVRIYAWN